MNPTVKRVLQRSALLVLSASMTLVFLESAVRLLVPAHEWRLRDTTADWRIDPELGWSNRPNQSVPYRTADGKPALFETNEDGLVTRASRERRPGAALRVMVFGDSTVVGRAVAGQERIDARLEARLLEAGVRAEVINAGVEGYSTGQALLAMRKWLPLYKPDLVLYGMCANDLGGNVSDTAYGLNHPRWILGPGGELRPAPFTPSRKLRPFGARSYRAWIQRSALYRLLQPALLKLRARWMTWDERNQLGMGDDYYRNPEHLERADWALFAALIRGMRDEAAAHGAAFAFYSHPSLEEVWDPYIERVRSSGRSDAYDRYARKPPKGSRLRSGRDVLPAHRGLCPRPGPRPLSPAAPGSPL